MGLARERTGWILGLTSSLRPGTKVTVWVFGPMKVLVQAASVAHSPARCLSGARDPADWTSPSHPRH
eukprot:10184971-Alexandrium_andersonii.AAC.1